MPLATFGRPFAPTPLRSKFAITVNGYRLCTFLDPLLSCLSLSMFPWLGFMSLIPFLSIVYSYYGSFVMCSNFLATIIPVLGETGGYWSIYCKTFSLDCKDVLAYASMGSSLWNAYPLSLQCWFLHLTGYCQLHRLGTSLGYLHQHPHGSLQLNQLHHFQRGI